jgi:probable F420-dependent oxidoreductase
MRIGVFLPDFAPPPDVLAAIGSGAEDRGFSSLWLGEHVVAFDDNVGYPYDATGAPPTASLGGRYEPFQALTFLAAVTERIRLGTAVCIVPQRNPVYTAKAVTTLDRLSGGRFDFGIGVGWSRRELEALDLGWSDRGARADEYLDVMRRLWMDEVSSYDGNHYRLPPCRQLPRPVQAPHPPILVGGNGPAALRRVVHQQAGWLALDLTPTELAEGLQKIRRLQGQDEATPAGGTRVVVVAHEERLEGLDAEQYGECGADELVVLGRAHGHDPSLRLLDRLHHRFLT